MKIVIWNVAKFRDISLVFCFPHTKFEQKIAKFRQITYNKLSNSEIAILLEL
jgi:hypothetical protein